MVQTSNIEKAINCQLASISKGITKVFGEDLYEFNTYTNVCRRKLDEELFPQCKDVDAISPAAAKEAGVPMELFAEYRTRKFFRDQFNHLKDFVLREYEALEGYLGEEA